MNALRLCVITALFISACGSPAQGTGAARAVLNPGIVLRFMVTGALHDPDITYEIHEDGRLTFTRVSGSEDYSASSQLTQQDLQSLHDRLAEADVCGIPSRTVLLLADARTFIWDVRMGAMDCQFRGQAAAGDRFPEALSDVVRWMAGLVDTGVDDAPAADATLDAAPAADATLDAAPVDEVSESEGPVDAERADAAPVDAEPADAAPVDEASGSEVPRDVDAPDHAPK